MARDEFYVGYVDHAPGGVASHVRRVAGALLVLAVSLALLLVLGQAHFDEGVFEFGVRSEVTGIVGERPYPLVWSRKDGAGELSPQHLVGPGKHGAAPLVAGRDGEALRLGGSRIFNDSQRMLELRDVEAIADAEARGLAAAPLPAVEQLGRVTLVGEIVDSKCHLGVMKPGRGKPHKACAIRCISGGVPPLLRVEDRAGAVRYFLLVDEQGAAVNARVLDWVAEPVEIEGRLTRRGGLLVLHADPTHFRSPR